MVGCISAALGIKHANQMPPVHPQSPEDPRKQFRIVQSNDEEAPDDNTFLGFDMSDSPSSVVAPQGAPPEEARVNSRDVVELVVSSTQAATRPCLTSLLGTHVDDAPLSPSHGSVLPLVEERHPTDNLEVPRERRDSGFVYKWLPVPD